MRARINERLASAARFPVTLIVAPAGFGKSIALRDFLGQAGIEAVRYDVRREDGTLLAFVRSFSEALEPVAASAIAAFPAMQERVLAAQEPVRQISDWFAEHLKNVRTTIVIDDLHYASTDAASIALLADVIERTSERIRWIIAARSDVGLPVGSWVAYGRMDLPIGEEELRFTTEEALAAGEQTHTKMDPTEIEALRQLTEGWPVALTIALRTRTHSADLRSASFGARELVYRYLAEQVFSGLNLQQRAFALASCVFSSFNVEIAQALGATPEFVSHLRSNLAFLTEVNPGEYRYHDLFRDFLESELRRSGESEWTRAVCEAAQLLENRAQYADALTLYTKAHAAKGIVRIVERYGFSLFERGQSEPLAAALAVLPEKERQSNAAALGLRAMLDAARGHFEIAQPGFIAAIDATQDTALRMTLVHRYAIELVRNGRDCVEFLEPYAADASLEPALRVPLLGTLATGYARQHEFDRARAAIEAALALPQSEVDDDLRARFLQQAAHVFDVAGSTELAERYADMAVELATLRNLYDVAARAYSVLYSLRYDDDDAAASLIMLEHLGECARKGGSAQTRAYGLIASYEVQAELGNDDALALLEAEIRETHAFNSPNRSESLLPAQALRAAWSGGFERAYEMLAPTVSEELTEERRAVRAAETALYAMASGMQEAADAMVQQAEEWVAQSPARSRRTIFARVLLALCELMHGRSAHANRLLSAAESTTQPNMRRLRALCNAVRAIYRMRMEQADESAVSAALDRLQEEQFGGFALLLRRLPLTAGEGGTFATLTPAEREILLLLAQGASTKDVANRTGRSPHTVDTHIRSLCRKLGCSGRREAVALATRQGWVQT